MRETEAAKIASAPVRRPAQMSRYLAAFAITTLIFLIGIIIGNYISSVKLDNIDDLQQELTKKTISSELQYLLMSEHPCQSIHTDELTKELFDIGTRLDFMEAKEGKDNRDVLKLKGYYSLLETRHWLFVKKAKKECGLNSDLILYFYSNTGDCPDCQQQGYVLSTIHKKYPDVNIYSFDINLDDPAIRTIEGIYNVTSAPALVVNERVLYGFHDMAAVERVLVQEGTQENRTGEERDMSGLNASSS